MNTRTEAGIEEEKRTTLSREKQMVEEVDVGSW